MWHNFLSWSLKGSTQTPLVRYVLQEHHPHHQILQSSVPHAHDEFNEQVVINNCPGVNPVLGYFWSLWTVIPKNLIHFLKEVKIFMPPPSCVVLCMKATQKDSATISKSVVEGFQRLKTFKTPPPRFLKMNAMIYGERSCLSLNRCIILRDKDGGS